MSTVIGEMSNKMQPQPAKLVHTPGYAGMLGTVAQDLAGGREDDLEDWPPPTLKVQWCA
jgi:hypothetical protein